jgi:hypothetical protein
MGWQRFTKPTRSGQPDVPIGETRTLKPADVTSLRMPRRAKDRIDRDDSGNWYSFTRRTY